MMEGLAAADAELRIDMIYATYLSTPPGIEPAVYKETLGG